MPELFAPLSLSDIQSQRKKVKKYTGEETRLEKLAIFITNKIGTMGFFLIIFTWTTVWLLWNFLAPSYLKFDPPMSFVLWLFISNCIQILLMPLIMVSQNLESKKSSYLAQSHYELDKKIEKETDNILQLLEYQNEILHLMLKGETNATGSTE